MLAKVLTQSWGPGRRAGGRAGAAQAHLTGAGGRVLPAGDGAVLPVGLRRGVDKLVAGLGWARRFRDRLELGMQPSPAAITYARQRLGWQVMERLLEETAGPLAGRTRSARSCPGCAWQRSTGCAWTCPITRRTGQSSLPGQRRRPRALPAIRVVGPGMRDPGGTARRPRRWPPEQPLARLLGRLSPGDLLLADRNFLGHGLLADVLATGEPCCGGRSLTSTCRCWGCWPTGPGYRDR